MKTLHSLAPTATQNLRNAHGPTGVRKGTGAVTIVECVGEIRSKVGEGAMGLPGGGGSEFWIPRQVVICHDAVDYGHRAPRCYCYAGSRVVGW